MKNKTEKTKQKKEPEIKPEGKISGNLLILNLTVITVLTILACSSAIISFKEVYKMRGVIKRLSAEREVQYEKPGISNKSRCFKEGYMAAMMDKRNIFVFREYYTNKRDPIIFDFFRNFEKLKYNAVNRNKKDKKKMVKQMENIVNRLKRIKEKVTTDLSYYEKIYHTKEEGN